MRGKIRRHFDRILNKIVLERLRSFVTFHRNPFGTYWVRRDFEGCSFFFFVNIDPRDDKFTVGIGWHDGWQDAWHDNLGIFFKASALLNPESDRALGCIPYLWGDPYFWFDVEPEYTAGWAFDLEHFLENPYARAPDHLPVETLLPRVEPLVEEAMQKFMQYGIPILEKVAEHKGIDLPENWWDLPAEQ